MNRPKNPTESAARERKRPEPRTRQGEDEEYNRTIPGRRIPENQPAQEIVNEDKQLKVVNEREDNAQSRTDAPSGQASDPELNRTDRPHENERLEAADDNNEVHPREPKVN